MITGKKIIKYIGLFAGILAVAIIGIAVFQYIEFNKTAKAISTMPWQSGGKIAMVRFCVWDTPIPFPTTCAISCPLVAEIYGSACMAFNQIDIAPQFATGINKPDYKISSIEQNFIAAPKSFVYSGGGSFPTAGMDYVAGGSSNAVPWVIGIPGLAVNNIDKIKNWFDKYIIAIFKD